MRRGHSTTLVGQCCASFNWFSLYNPGQHNLWRARELNLTYTFELLEALIKCYSNYKFIFKKTIGGTNLLLPFPFHFIMSCVSACIFLCLGHSMHICSAAFSACKQATSIPSTHDWRLPCLLGLCCRGSVSLCKWCLPDEKEAGAAVMFTAPDCVKLASGTSEGALLYLAVILTMAFFFLLSHIFETEGPLTFNTCVIFFTQWVLKYYSKCT